MNSLYTPEIRNFFRSVTWPRNLVVDVIEYDTHISLRLYRDNFESFDGEDKLHISRLIGETINAVRKQGCPVFLEVEAGNGRNNLPN